VPVVKVREESINVRTRTTSTPRSSDEASDVKLKKMVLPKVEKRKVEEHATEVERDVLIRRKVPTTPAKTTGEKSTDKSREKSKGKTTDTSREKSKERTTDTSRERTSDTSKRKSK
jgi:hypothetical protein